MGHHAALNVTGSGHTVDIAPAVMFFINIVICLVGIAGNILVCVVIRRSRRVQSTTNYFVVAIAVADISYSAITMPFVGGHIIAQEWEFGEMICRLIRWIQYASPGVVLYVFMSISVDRFYTIIYPLSFKIKRGTSKRMIAFCWSFAFILTTFCLFVFRVKRTDGRMQCEQFVDPNDLIGTVFTMATVLLQFLIPGTVMIVLYIKVWNHVWRIGENGRLQRTPVHVSRTKVSMVKMLMVTSIATVILYCPFYVALFLYGFATSVQGSLSLHVYTLLVFGAGMTKPFLYMYFNANFRRGCKEVVCLSHSRCHRGNNYAITNPSRIGKHNHVGVLPVNNFLGDSPSKMFDRSLADQSQWPFQSTDLPITTQI